MATNLRFVKEFTFNQWGGATFFAIDECFTDAFDVYYVTLNKVSYVTSRKGLKPLKYL